MPPPSSLLPALLLPLGLSMPRYAFVAVHRHCRVASPLQLPTARGRVCHGRLAKLAAACCSSRAATSHLRPGWIDQRVRMGPGSLPATSPPPATTMAAGAASRPPLPAAVLRKKKVDHARE